MTRETLVNVGLGFILLIAFAVPFLGCIGAIFLVLYAVGSAVKHFVPAVAHTGDVALNGFVCLGILAVGARQLWLRMWANAFLSLTAAVTILLPWLLSPRPHHLSADLAIQFPVVWLIVYLLPPYSRLSRGEFAFCASVIAANFALNTGLLGSGALSTIVGAGLAIAVIAWIFVCARDGKYGEPWSHLLATPHVAQG
jgi:hypothetical protein